MTKKLVNDENEVNTLSSMTNVWMMEVMIFLMSIADQKTTKFGISHGLRLNLSVWKVLLKRYLNRQRTITLTKICSS